METSKVTGNNFPKFPNSFHMNTKYNLDSVRSGFDKAVIDKRLKAQTSNKYRKWIRKYLLFIKNNSFNLHEVDYFLNSIQSPHQKRQAYYSLKFLFDNVLKCKYPKHFYKLSSNNKASYKTDIALTNKLKNLFKNIKSGIKQLLRISS